MDSMLARSKAWLSKRRAKAGKHAASTDTASADHGNTDPAGTDLADTTPAKTYHYTALQDELREIRLLVILPYQGPAGPLSCWMMSASLDDPTLQYEAISYVWGDPTPCVALYVDGHKMLVPASSDEVLRCIALPDQERIVWIDAVCINQADLEERSTQVASMGTIFGRATSVLVYLGAPDEYTKLAYTNIVALNREIDEDIGPGVDITKHPRQHSTFYAPIRTEVNVEALIAFFSRAWFRRVWVVQEFAAAKHVRAISGSQVFKMRKVLRVAFWLREWHVRNIDGKLDRLLKPFYRMWVAYVYRCSHRGIDFHKGLRIMLQRKALDPRDKVFAMLGLLEPSLLHSRILPDYTKPVEHVFRDFARQHIIANHGLGISSYIFHRDRQLFEEQRISSWAPDLSRPHTGSTLILGTGVFGNPSVATDCADRVQDVESLTIRGISLDHVVEDLNVHGISTNLSLLKKAVGMTGRSGVEDYTLARTLISGLNMETQYPDSDGNHSALIAYRDWLKYLQDDIHIPVERVVRSAAGIYVKAKRASLYSSVARFMCHRRRLGITEDKSLGLFPKLCQPGDLVVVAHGARAPFLLRPRGDHYLLVGECYLDGYMRWQEHGEELHQRLMDEEGEDFHLR